MDRVDLKRRAKGMIVPNLGRFWKAAFLVMLIMAALGGILGLLFRTDVDFSFGEGLSSGASNILLAPLMIGLQAYILKITRGKKEDMSELWKYFSKYWVIIAITLVVNALIFIGLVFLIIPGIIIGLGFTFVNHLIADNPEMGIQEALKKAWDLTNGYKADIFILGLSFFGWMLLIPVTLGIAAIWIMPYISYTFALYYDELKKVKKIK